jgi:putative membrane protein insertion efficiency factor
MIITLKPLTLLALSFYRQAISPYKPKCCRFVPSCSQYAVEAVEKYGTKRGLFLALKRLLRCHPFHKGGYDPVP